MFEPEGFSKEIFRQRYAFTENENWEEACYRVASQMAKAETPEKYTKYQNKFFHELLSNRFCPGGRIWYNSGRNKPQLLNCFVLRADLDSKEGWGELSKEMIITSMTGGGCGIDFSDVRPNGAEIKGQKGEAPGPVELMKLINGNGAPVKAGGARRVALMFSLDLTHPDIEQFLDEKLKLGQLDKANVSVRIKDMDEFINAIKNDEDLELSWKGKYHKKVKAKKLWNKIVKNAWESAEPGILNWDLALSESTIYYLEDVVTTNPCGEITLSPYESCCLGHLVLPRFIVDGKINFEELGETIRIAVRFLDNVHSVNIYPLPQMSEKGQKYRRLGLGTTGLADMLALMGLKYGSKESNVFIEKLYKFISKQAYEASIMLAVEKGSFEGFDAEKHLKSGFVKRMSPKIKSLLADHGIRNCALLTIAPTGTVSILSGNCSSGIEPMFAPAYERRFWVKDKREKELVFHPLFKKFMEEGKDVSHFIGASELEVEQHMEVQKIIQKYIDNAVSKTINMPEKYPIKTMGEVWLKYLPFLKGTTFYRESSRGYINEKGEKEEPPLVALSMEDAKKQFTKESKDAKIVDCKSGKCEL